MYWKQKLSIVFLLLLLVSLAWSPQGFAAVEYCAAQPGGDQRGTNMVNAVRLTATADASAPNITLNWQSNSDATGYNVYRKLRDSAEWGSPTAVGNVTTWVDSNVAVGDAWEYRVDRMANGCADQTGYIFAGVEAAMVEDRGKLILLVDSTFTSALAMELERLESDLAGDGWTVIRHDVARSTTVPAVKQLITTDYNADPGTVKAVFIVGHVAVPYSGYHATDEHYDQRRAFPADLFYADIDGTWTDSTVNRSGAINPNVPGDGVYDQSQIVAAASGPDHAPELLIGRVDFHDMASFTKSETELLRQYLNKNHAWRHGQISVRQRAILADKMGELSGWNVPGVGMWHSMVPLVGANETWIDEPQNNNNDGIFITPYRPSTYLNPAGYIFADANSFAGYTEMFDSYASLDYETNDPPIIFYVLFGSFFGDWDTTDNLLRAPLAAENYGLATVWGVWGTATMHHMGLGAPIGYSLLATHNGTTPQSDGSSQLYNTYFDHTTPEMTIMGDPTLRMHVVAPVSDLQVDAGGGLSWSAAPGADGYHVYRQNMDGSWSRLTGSAVVETSYVDMDAPSGDSTWMVRSAKVETSPSGSYWNAGQGVFVSAEITQTPTAATISSTTSTNQTMTVPVLIACLAIITVVVRHTGIKSPCYI